MVGNVWVLSGNKIESGLRGVLTLGPAAHDEHLQVPRVGEGRLADGNASGQGPGGLAGAEHEPGGLVWVQVVKASRLDVQGLDFCVALQNRGEHRALEDQADWNIRAR